MAAAITAEERRKRDIARLQACVVQLHRCIGCLADITQADLDCLGQAINVLNKYESRLLDCK
jgi:hypothetical protein